MCALFNKYRKQIYPEGLLPYRYSSDGEFSRIFLRIDSNLNGVLIVNASKIFHLNKSGTLMAYLILEKKSHDETINVITKQFKVNKIDAISDFRHFSDQFKEIIRPDGACPIHELDLDILQPFQVLPNAPYRMDLAVTYRCNNNCSHCYNARQRDYPEITTHDWFQIIDKIFDIGIPHVVFTGGEPTLRADLSDLIRYAERKGMVTGINTNGRKLSNQAYLIDLIDSGLDHVQITIESHDPIIHDNLVCHKGAYDQTISGLKNALAGKIYVMTNTTLLKQNSPYLLETLELFSKLGVTTIGINSLINSGKGQLVETGLLETDLAPIMKTAYEITKANNQRLIWYSPTKYCNFNPIDYSLGVKGCTAAKYNMCIEPDGSVIPCQSYYSTLGNILTDSWDSIWNHDLAINLRNKNYLPEKCVLCELINECGGGCPLAISTF
jgi:radical SAM protein with 4Fe4S-binding SPASM domain